MPVVNPNVTYTVLDEDIYDHRFTIRLTIIFMIAGAFAIGFISMCFYLNIFYDYLDNKLNSKSQTDKHISTSQIKKSDMHILQYQLMQQQSSLMAPGRLSQFGMELTDNISTIDNANNPIDLQQMSQNQKNLQQLQRDQLQLQFLQMQLQQREQEKILMNQPHLLQQQQQLQQQLLEQSQFQFGQQPNFVEQISQQQFAQPKEQSVKKEPSSGKLAQKVVSNNVLSPTYVPNK